MAALFEAVDLTTLTSNVTTLIIGFIGIGLLFLGWRFIKRFGVR